MNNNVKDFLYVKSPYIKIENLDETKLECSNIITRKKFAINSNTKIVIDQFLVPQKPFEAMNTLSIEQDLFDKVFGNLVRAGIIVPDQEKILECIRLVPASYSLFAVPEYTSTVEAKEVVFVGVPFGSGNGISDGSKKFPNQVRSYTTSNNINLNEKIEDINFGFLGEPKNYLPLQSIVNKRAIKDAGDVFVHFYEERHFVYEKIKSLASDFFKKKKVPFFLGGDHSISGPLIKACSEHNQELHVIQFDAHTDTYASPFDDILSFNGIHHHGNFVSGLLSNPNIAKIYQIGMRGATNARISAKEKQELIWSHEFRKNEQWPIDKFLIPSNVPCYITFDIDFFDPSVAPGTATPMINGCTIDDVKRFFINNLSALNIVGLDLVEVNPDRDKDKLTMQTAIETILELLNLVRI
jgi:agmatinase